MGEGRFYSTETRVCGRRGDHDPEPSAGVAPAARAVWSSSSHVMARSYRSTGSARYDGTEKRRLSSVKRAW